MRIGSPFNRRWLLYGVLVSLAHLCVVWFFGVIIDAGIVTDRLTPLGSWLVFPGVTKANLIYDLGIWKSEL